MEKKKSDTGTVKAAANTQNEKLRSAIVAIKTIVGITENNKNILHK